MWQRCDAIDIDSLREIHSRTKLNAVFFVFQMYSGKNMFKLSWMNEKGTEMEMKKDLHWRRYCVSRFHPGWR